MLRGFFRSPVKHVEPRAELRPASPQSQRPERWTLVPHAEPGTLSTAASVADLTESCDSFDSAHISAPRTEASDAADSVTGLPHYWGLSSPTPEDVAQSSQNLVMPTFEASDATTLCPVETRALTLSRTISPLDMHDPRGLSPSLSDSAVSPIAAQHRTGTICIRQLMRPVGSAIAASCATVAYHAVSTLVMACYDAAPVAVVPAGIDFLASHYPAASLVGAAAGSLWALQRLCHAAGDGDNVRANRTSMCISAVTTSFWLFAMGPAAIFSSAGSVALDLAQPAAQTYLLGALGLVYHTNWFDTASTRTADHTEGGKLLMSPEAVELFLSEHASTDDHG